MSASDRVLDAHHDALHSGATVGQRRHNPITRGIPLTVDEAWVLVQLGLIDIAQGTLMTWGGDSDCADVEAHAENEGGECLCWNGAMDKEGYRSITDLKLDGPFEWWPSAGVKE